MGVHSCPRYIAFRYVSKLSVLQLQRGFSYVYYTNSPAQLDCPGIFKANIRRQNANMYESILKISKNLVLGEELVRLSYSQTKTPKIPRGGFWDTYI